MDKRHFYFKLIPPRPTFANDITDEERALMAKHGAYCQTQFEAGPCCSTAQSRQLKGPLAWEFSRLLTKPRPAISARMTPRCLPA